MPTSYPPPARPRRLAKGKRRVKPIDSVDASSIIMIRHMTWIRPMRNADSALAGALVLVAIFLLAGCDESPTGRGQVTLVPDAQMAAIGRRGFEELLRSESVSGDPGQRAYVACITQNLIAALPEPHGEWRVALFENPAPNAFALPGGRIGINTGMLRIAEDQDQLAAVIAHEIAHVIAEHGNERLTQQLAVQGGLLIIDLLAEEPGSLEHEVLRKALGLGAQYGLLLPYSRVHEREADRIGLDLMARAGFDPAASLALWRNMAAAGADQPLEFLSTHPSHETRLAELAEGMDAAQRTFEEATRQGRRPRCGGR